MLLNAFVMAVAGIALIVGALVLIWRAICLSLRRNIHSR